MRASQSKGIGGLCGLSFRVFRGHAKKFPCEVEITIMFVVIACKVFWKFCFAVLPGKIMNMDCISDGSQRIH